MLMGSLQPSTRPQALGKLPRLAFPAKGLYECAERVLAYLSRKSLLRASFNSRHGDVKFHAYADSKPIKHNTLTTFSNTGFGCHLP